MIERRRARSSRSPSASTTGCTACPGDGGPLGERRARGLRGGRSRPTPSDLSALLAPGDIVILHDPQTAGLDPAGCARGVPVIWRCHVGLDVPNELAREAWGFLEPYVLQADAYVFSREAFVWDELDPARAGDHRARRSTSSRPRTQSSSPRRVDAHPRRRAACAAGTARAPSFRRIDGSTGGGRAARR